MGICFRDSNQWFAKELGFESLVVEVDSKIIINLMNGESMLYSEVWHIIQDIKLLSSSLTNVYFHHVKRQGNCVAYKLASCNSFYVWMESVPFDILDVYNFDLSLID